MNTRPTVIVWTDSCSQDEATIEELHQETLIRTVGFVVKETKSTVHLTQDVDIEQETFRNTTVIPKRNIVRRRDW